MKITKEEAVELLELFRVGDTTESDAWEGLCLKFELVREELVGTTRWSHVYERIYKDLESGKFYSTTYSTGATECQDEAPYEYDSEGVELVEVEPYEVKVIKYREVK